MEDAGGVVEENNVLDKLNSEIFSITYRLEWDQFLTPETREELLISLKVLILKRKCYFLLLTPNP